MGAAMELTPGQAGAEPGEPTGPSREAGGHRGAIYSAGGRGGRAGPAGDGVAVPACPSCRSPCNNELSVCTNEIVLSVKGSSRRGDGRASDCVAKEKRKEKLYKKNPTTKNPAAKLFCTNEVCCVPFAVRLEMTIK